MRRIWNFTRTFQVRVLERHCRQRRHRRGRRTSTWPVAGLGESSEKLPHTCGRFDLRAIANVIAMHDGWRTINIEGSIKF